MRLVRHSLRRSELMFTGIERPGSGFGGLCSEEDAPLQNIIYMGRSGFRA